MSDVEILKYNINECERQLRSAWKRIAELKHYEEMADSIKVISELKSNGKTEEMNTAISSLVRKLSN